ncbi:MAG: RluA family pseudouridine synthase [Candidatus Omnitrophica bacterium]|nr:RluA family pseudouridine synthase [Candidatus Omnitrophota bacterium]
MPGTETLIVEENSQLLAFLLTSFPHLGRNKVKSFLKYNSVSVNGRIATRHDHPLHTGDQVSVKTNTTQPSEKEFLKSLVNIVYEDDTLIVINKPSGLLTVATEKIKNDTAIHLVNEYLNSGSGRREKKIFVVHRLDQGASGLLVFAKTHEAKHELQNHWDQTEKHYYAVVEGKPQEETGTVISYLQENSRMKVYSTTRGGAKHSVTRYKLVKSNGQFSLLDIHLQTGRKHQIRVHMADIGTPIIGDDRYGAKTNPAGRLGLHSYSLSIIHPVTKKRMEFKTELPHVLKKVIDSKGA